MAAALAASVEVNLLSGFIQSGIEIAIKKILHHAAIARHCKKKMNALRDLVARIEPYATQIRQYRLELNRQRGNPNDNASQWVEKLHTLLQRALPLVQYCTIPSFDPFARYKISGDITSLISEIENHLEFVPLVILEQQTRMLMEMPRERAEQASSSTSASTSRALTPMTSFFIEEEVIVGQEQAFQILEKLVIDAELKSVFRVGVHGKGGSGKTLLLKTLFNSQKVRDLFHTDGLLLWLTVSETPSFLSLRNDLRKQISTQINEVYDENMNEEDAKKWVSRTVQAKRFALFLDDVWGGGGKLLEELGLSRLSDHSNYKIIVSSRNRRALSEMGVADASIIAMGDLSKEKSWELFARHAFPYNNGNQPANIDERMAKVVCDKCGGLPLAIKVTGRTMAAITDADEWELAMRGLPNDNSEDHRALDDRLRWSYDALGNYDVNLQLCFLYLSAFSEDQVINVEEELIPLWLGEGLLERGHDPFQMGRIYARQLADRCLIEPVVQEVDGRVVRCRMHDVLRGLAIKIGEQEEKLYCRAGNGLTVLVENEYSGCTRLFLNNNDLRSFPVKSSRAPEICSLLIGGNKIKEIPSKVIRSMISLKVLDLSDNWYIQSLPESIGCLKQLVVLRLQGVGIKRLPTAVTDLASLEMLDLSRSEIRELPSSIHKLRSLRYLNLSCCRYLQCLPRSISQLTSLLHLDMWRCYMWMNVGSSNVGSFNDLRSLTQLKRLSFTDLCSMVEMEGTLGSMVEMETLHLHDEEMRSLPDDMMKMSKLKRLRLGCPLVVKMDSKFCELQNLSDLRLTYLRELKELPDLQKLKGLRKLVIDRGSNLKKFPEEFGEKGAFPLLEVFILRYLDILEVLPTIMVKEDVLLSLKEFIIIGCRALKMLPENYLHLQKLQNIKIYDCSMLLENLKKLIQTVNTNVKVVEMSITDVIEIDAYYD